MKGARDSQKVREQSSLKGTQRAKADDCPPSILDGIARKLLKTSRFFQEVRAEALREAREEKSVPYRRECLLDCIDARFGSAARSGLEEAVQGVKGPDELRRLLRLAVTCATPEAFRAALPAAAS